MYPVDAVLDANVLYNFYLRGYLLWLQTVFNKNAVPVMFYWTEQILDETFRNIQKRKPGGNASRFQERRAQIARHFPAAFVSGYARHIPFLFLPDPDDRHVLAAAIEAEAHYIVTFNLRDFPIDALRPHGVAAAHPDNFLCRLLDSYPSEMADAADLSVRSYENPPLTPCEFLTILERSPKDPTQSVVPAFAQQMKARLGCG